MWPGIIGHNGALFDVSSCHAALKKYCILPAAGWLTKGKATAKVDKALDKSPFMRDATYSTPILTGVPQIDGSPVHGLRRHIMTKADIVEDIAQKTGLTKKEVAETVDLFLVKIGDLLVEGRHLEIRGFGTFKVKERKERMARNPRTGEAVPVPARKVPIFKVSKMLKDKVAG